MIRVRPSAPEEVARGYVRRTAHFESNASVEDIWFLTPAAHRPLADDWLLPAGLIVGMILGEDVHIAGRVSERLLASTEEIQRITALRHDALKRIRITAEEVAPTPLPTRARTVACFSAGVDAFYTALDPEAGADALLYVHGFDANHGDDRTLAAVIPHVRAAARELDRPLILAESNWRSTLAPLKGYPLFVGSPLLFTIGYLLGSDATQLILPGTCDHEFEQDLSAAVRSYVRHWSTEAIKIAEHGHVPRFEKIRRIADSPIAMRHLRVCWGKNLPFYNCGRCIKCTRTRVQLKLAGAEGRCRTLPPHLDPAVVRRAPAEKPAHRYYLEESIAEAESQEMSELADALRVQLAREFGGPRSREPGAQLARWMRRVQWSYRKRRCDAAVRRLKRRCGGAHLFDCLGADAR